MNLIDYSQCLTQYEEMGNGYLVTLRYEKQKVTTRDGVITEQVILTFCIEPKNTSEIMQYVGLKHREHFRSVILKPMIEKGLLELTIPQKPKSPKQKYKTVKVNAS